jgi:hypothetical protein
MLNLTVGVETAGGIGGGLTFYNFIGDGDERFFADDFVQNLHIFGSYRTDNFFAKLTIGIPLFEDGIDRLGISITPEVAYTFDMGLKFYAALPIFGISAYYDDSIGVGLTIGTKFSF